MFLKRAVNTTMETNLIFDLHERSLVGTTSSLLPRRSASFLLILVFVLGGKMCSPGFRLPLKYRMTITKHPRLKANTMRMTLGFLILSLWERARSRTDPRRGSCEERGLRCVYFTTDRSISPARWTLCCCLSSYTSWHVQSGSRCGDEEEGEMSRHERARASGPWSCCGGSGAGGVTYWV